MTYIKNMFLYCWYIASIWQWVQNFCYFPCITSLNFLVTLVNVHTFSQVPLRVLLKHQAHRWKCRSPAPVSTMLKQTTIFRKIKGKRNGDALNVCDADGDVRCERKTAVKWTRCWCAQRDWCFLLWAVDKRPNCSGWWSWIIWWSGGARIGEWARR